MIIEDTFKKDFILCMASMQELIQASHKDEKFSQAHELLVEKLATAFTDFSQTEENILMGQLVWSYASFVVAAIDTLKKWERTDLARFEKTLFIASAIYLASTHALEDLLDVREE